MNIRQIQIFRQDLTNFNILGEGKKIGLPLLSSPIFLCFIRRLVCPSYKTEHRLHLPLVWSVRKADGLRVGRSWGYQVVSVLASGQYHAAYNV